MVGHKLRFTTRPVAACADVVSVKLIPHRRAVFAGFGGAVQGAVFVVNQNTLVAAEAPFRADDGVAFLLQCGEGGVRDAGFDVDGSRAGGGEAGGSGAAEVLNARGVADGLDV